MKKLKGLKLISTNTIFITLLLMVAIFCCFGCKKKQQQVVQEMQEIVEETTEEAVVDLQQQTGTSVLENEDGSMNMSFGGNDSNETSEISATTNDTSLEGDSSNTTIEVKNDFEKDLDSSEDGEYSDEDAEIDFSVFNELSFEESNAIFTVTSLENTLGDVEGVLTVYTKAVGSLSGMPGTYELVVPFTEEWKRGDRAHVSYKTCYLDDEEEGESLIVSDLIFIEKTDDKAVSRAAQLAVEREEQARRESEEAAAKADIEESKKRAEAELARQRAENENIRRQAQISFEQQQAAIVESIKAKEALANQGVAPAGY